MRLFLLFLLSSLAMSGCVQPRPDSAAARSEPAPPYTLERFREEAKVVDGVQTLVIDNPYGETTVRNTHASAIAWQGVEQRIGASPRIARIEAFHEASRQGVRVRYPGIDPKAKANPQLGRVDLYVFVPPEIKLELASDFGMISVRKLDNDVLARSRSGMIVVASRGSFDLESSTGELRAFPMQGLGGSSSRAKTGGNVIVDVPVFDDILVEVQSGGELRSDVPLDNRSIDANGVTRAQFSHGTQKSRIDVIGGNSVILQSLNKPIPDEGDADD